MLRLLYVPLKLQTEESDEVRKSWILKVQPAK